MPSPKPPAKPVFFTTAARFRAWLEKHHDRASELTVGFHRVGSGKPSLTWPQSVDEALCFGWIDSVRRSLGEESYQIRFTPRREGSIWSAVNIRRAEALIAEGRMTAAGLAAFERRTEEKSIRYSYEQERAAELTPEEIGKFRKNKAAWTYFEKAPPGYRRMMLHWLASAKRQETRARRLDKLIAGCAAGVRYLP